MSNSSDIPKSAKERVALRRERARKAGLCGVCCKGKPNFGRAICALCTAAKTERKKRRRDRDREAKALRGLSLQVEQTLTQNQTVEDELQLYTAIASSLYTGARPDLALPWFERIVERSLSIKEFRSQLSLAMLALPDQYWLASNTREAIQAAKRAELVIASEITSTQEYRELLHLARTYGNIYRVASGHYSKAKRFVGSDENVVGAGRLGHVLHAKLGAVISATRGDAPEAFSRFEAVLEEGIRGTVILDHYALWAQALGHLDIAVKCYERALLLARDSPSVWRAPYILLCFANTVIRTGDYERAKKLFSDTITYDTQTPLLRVLRSAVALQLRQSLRNPDLFAGAVADDALDLALRSRNIRHFAPLASEYVKTAVARRDFRQAKSLITKALAMVPKADHAWELFPLTAQYGTPQEVERVKFLLRERMKLPNNDVSSAYYELCEAYSCRRRKERVAARNHAQRAASAFERLGWRHQQTEASSLLGRRSLATRDASVTQSTTILSDLPFTLTSREKQVAELALRGLTNRVIADLLTISERTVESHMTSILNRLGLRSRWQLMKFSQ